MGVRTQSSPRTQSRPRATGTSAMPARTRREYACVSRRPWTASTTRGLKGIWTTESASQAASRPQKACSARPPARHVARNAAPRSRHSSEAEATASVRSIARAPTSSPDGTSSVTSRALSRPSHPTTSSARRNPATGARSAIAQVSSTAPSRTAVTRQIMAQTRPARAPSTTTTAAAGRCHPDERATSSRPSDETEGGAGSSALRVAKGVRRCRLVVARGCARPGVPGGGG